LRFKEGIIQPILLHQDLRSSYAIQGRSQRNVELPVVNENSMLDNCCRRNSLELAVRLQRIGAKLIAGQHASTDQNRAVNLCRDINPRLQPNRGDRSQRLAGNAVVGGIYNYRAEICEPAVLDATLIEGFFHHLELLRPVGVRVAEISVTVRRTSPELVGIRDVGRKGTNRRHYVENKDYGNDICPNAAALDNCGSRPSRQNQEEGKSRQNVADTDVH